MTTPFRELAARDPEAATAKLLAVFARAGGYVDRAARALGITRQHLSRLVKLLGASADVEKVRHAARLRRKDKTGSRIASTRPKKRRRKAPRLDPDAEQFKGVFTPKEADD